MFVNTYSNVPWKSYKMYNNVEKENCLLYKKISDITQKQTQNQNTLKEQQYEFNQNNQLLKKVRQRQQNSARITEENKKLFQKLNTQKPHINAQQQQLDYQQKKQIIKRLTRFPLQNSKMNHSQPSNEFLKINQIATIVPENKSFLLTDQKSQEFIKEINNEEMKEMRDSLRDGSYKLINFSTKENKIMTQRPCTSMNTHKNSIKKIQYSQRLQKDSQLQYINNTNLIQSDKNNGQLPPKTSQIRKRAQSANKTCAIKNLSEQKQEKEFFYDLNEYSKDINDNINIQLSSLNQRRRSESICERNIKQHDIQDQMQIQDEQYQKQEINQQYYLKLPVSERNYNKQSSQSHYGTKKGESLMYSTSYINSINQNTTIEQRTQQDCTISINQFIKNHATYSPITQQRSQIKGLNGNKITVDSIQVMEDFDDTIEGKQISQCYNKSGKVENNKMYYIKKSQLGEVLDLKQLSKTQTFQMSNSTSQDIRNDTTQYTNKEYQKSCEDTHKLNNRSLQSQRGVLQFEQQNNDPCQNTKTKRINQINQQMFKIISKNNNYNQQSNNQSSSNLSYLNRIQRNKNNIDMESSPTIQNIYNNEEQINKETKFSQSLSKYLNVCYDRSTKKCYQQNILTGNQVDELDNIQINCINVNGFDPALSSERKESYHNIKQNRRKSIVTQSLNCNSGDNSINFLKIKKSQSKAGCSTIQHTDISFQNMMDIPINKRLGTETPIMNAVNQKLPIKNLEDKQANNNSKNPLSYILPQLNYKEDKYTKNQ